MNTCVNENDKRLFKCKNQRLNSSFEPMESFLDEQLGMYLVAF